MSFRTASLGVLVTFLTAALPLAEGERMTPELLWDLQRLGASAVSGDGGLVAYTVRSYEVEEDAGTTSLFVLSLESREARPLLRDWASVGDLQFAPSPFGERIFFTGLEERGDGAPQAWALNPVDGALLRITELEDGVSNLKVSPTGRHIAFTQEVKLEPTLEETYPDLPKAKARIFDSLMIRHWTVWRDESYSHLHIAPIQEDGHAGEPVDLMKDKHADCPVPPFGGSEQFAWSPDGTSIAYTLKDVHDWTKWAQSTDSDVYLVSIDDPTEVLEVSRGRPGYDNDPVFSPDGRYLAYHSMERAGFESDRNRILVFDRETGQTVEATEGLDQMAHGATWLPDSSGLLFSSEYRGTQQLFRVGRSGGGASQVSHGRFNFSLRDVLPDGKHAIVSFMDMTRPPELALLSLADGSLRPLTDLNGEIYAKLELPRIEERWVPATDGEKIHCWVIYPPDFDPSRKWPLLTYCQGGPQGQIGQWFSYRWNFHLMAAHGYVVIAPNRRGLPGFGREWNDQISGDWGGQAMRDILSATDSMLAEPYIDADRAGAIGASFGGYTVYWLMGNHEHRFHCMVAHAGVFNLESMYGSTEELFFVNWDLGGPYWKSEAIQAAYDKFSPHRYVANWDTPILIVHGQKDFRVPVTQGIEAFTAAQVQGVPSRFLYYPDEGHWILKPQNGLLWHRVFFEWLDRYLKPAGTGE